MGNLGAGNDITGGRPESRVRTVSDLVTKRGPTETTLNIVVPCFNEEDALPETMRRLSLLLDWLVENGQIASQSGIYFIDDGSRDRTWTLIEDLSALQPERFHGIKLSRNQGHQNALLAGLLNVPGDMIVSIDADLQDDPETIVAMVQRFHEGCDIVFGVRSERPTDTMFKRRTARFYYALLRWLGAEVVPDHADFRLMSRRALDALSRYNEVNLFIRGIVPMLGFKTATESYIRAPRLAGETKYSLAKMAKLSIDGITSLSMRPLRMITGIGFFVSLASFLLGFWGIAVRLLSNVAIPGWTSTLVPIALLGGLQLLSLGMIGEYVGKIYLEVKRRPLFEIERIV
jgi:glycosyltransferase involved in cell wall biosynthesis